MSTMVLACYPLKKSCNLSQNCLSFTFPVTLSQPLFCGSVLLAFVAGTASGNHVCPDRTGASWFVQWNEMIGGQLHAGEETGKRTAVSAFPLPVVDRSLPLGRRERVWQCAPPSATAQYTNAVAHRVSLAMLPPSLFVLLLLGVFAFLYATVGFFAIGITPFLRGLSSLFRMFGVVGSCPLCLLLTVINSPFTKALLFLFWISGSAGFSQCLSAIAASCLQASFCILLFVEVFKRAREILMALAATFRRNRFVDHSVSLSLYLRMLSADGEISRRSGISLADFHIIPQLSNKSYYSQHTNGLGSRLKSGNLAAWPLVSQEAHTEDMQWTN